MGATEDVARFVNGLSLNKVPGPAVKAARMAILDCLGVSLAGSREPVGRIMVEAARCSGGKDTSTIIGSGIKTTAPEAALANGTMAHAMDYDDYCFLAGGHPSVTLVPAILALGEKRHISGKQVLEAYLVGFEVECRIGREIAYDIQSRGWHPTSVWGPMGAALACCKVLGLNMEQTRTALGIATAGTAGLRGNFGTMTKPLHAGKSASWGVIAAQMAEKGLTANEEILEAPLGFFNSMSVPGKYDLHRMTADLGSRFLISENLAFKPYPSCGISHPSIDAVLHLIDRHGILADDVAQVECCTGDTVPVTLRYHRPATVLEGKFSLEYCVAVALLDREVSLRQFTEERVRDPVVQAFLARVRYVHAPEHSGWDAHLGPQSVTIRLRDGREYSHEVVLARGQPQVPLNDLDMATKYRDCARRVLNDEAVERSLALLQGLEDVRDIRDLMGLVGS
ncbi:MAG: MmgE/PrpD family protein [Dehalococcoidia bacterium]|nr:MmgE/PrpD family protein [Dehalococcoidia bacterium]